MPMGRGSVAQEFHGNLQLLMLKIIRLLELLIFSKSHFISAAASLEEF